MKRLGVVVFVGMLALFFSGFASAQSRRLCDTEIYYQGHTKVIRTSCFKPRIGKTLVRTVSIDLRNGRRVVAEEYIDRWRSSRLASTLVRPEWRHRSVWSRTRHRW